MGDQSRVWQRKHAATRDRSAERSPEGQRRRDAVKAELERNGYSDPCSRWRRSLDTARLKRWSEARETV